MNRYIVVYSYNGVQQLWQWLNYWFTQYGETLQNYVKEAKCKILHTVYDCITEQKTNKKGTPSKVESYNS